MDSYVLIYIVDPKTGRSVAGSVTPSSVLDTIADVVGRYVASQPGMAATKAWAIALNHVPFLTPSSQLQRTQTVTRPKQDAGYGAMVKELILTIAPEAGQIIDADTALQTQLTKIGGDVRQSVKASPIVGLLLVLMTALPSDKGSAPVVKVYLVDRLIAAIQTSDIGTSGAKLNLTDVISAYAFDFGRMADAADRSNWQRFVCKTRAGGETAP